MKKLFRKYPEVILTTLALIFVALLVAVFSWGVGDIVTSVNKAINAESNGAENTSFNLGGAQALDLRGLVK